MKLKMNAVIKDLDDYPVPFTETVRDKKTGATLYEDEAKEHPKVTEHAMTLKDALIGALMTPMKGDESMDAAEKTTLFSLAVDIKKGSTELTAEEIVLIKGRIAKRYPPLVVGRVCELIEGKDGK